MSHIQDNVILLIIAIIGDYQRPSSQELWAGEPFMHRTVS